MLSLSLAIAFLAPLALARDNFRHHYNDIYLAKMCYPRYHDDTDTNRTRSRFLDMGESPFPCEQRSYLLLVCGSNGTTEIDFLAEQQCLCGGNFFDATRGCNECYFAHGSVEPDETREKALSRVNELSSAECSATPVTMPYTNLYPEPPRTFSDATISNDRFPNNTAVSNYWTGATAPIAGTITGSATARLTKHTNTDDVRYTPTDPPSTSSTNGAAEVKVAGGLLAVVIGAVAAL